MTIKVESVSMAGHVIVRAAGEWTEETFRSIVDFARDECARHDVNRVLLDMRRVSRPDLSLTRYISGVYLAETIGSWLRIAALGEPDNVTRYGETAARNRGSEFMVFTQEDSATEWLMR